MGRSLFDQDTQIRQSGTYTDNIAAGQANLETPATSLEFDLSALRSQVKRILDHSSGAWYDDVSTVNGKKRSLKTINTDLDDLEEHRFLFRTQILTDITVPAAVKATDILTLNSAPLNNETVVIGSTTYTFKTALTPANWEVLIEATASASIDNLVWAINNTAGHPGKFQVPNAHPDVAAAAGALDTMDVEALAAGTKGNLITATETLSDVASVWTTALLAGGAGDVVVLSVAGSEAPSEVGAIGAVTTKGAVAAYNSDFANWKLVKVTNSASAIQPKNLCIVRDASTGEVILSGSKEIYALLATEAATDGQTFNDTTQQVELVFVKENGTGDDLVQVPGTDIGGKTINYSYVRRIDLDNLPEAAFLSEVFIDQAGAVDITRQNAYDNQGTTPVNTTVDAVLDIETAGKKWEIRDSAEASLFKITENEVLGTTELAIGASVDSLNIDAILVDFDKGIVVDSGGVDIQLGKTAIANMGTIETLAGNDLRLDGARELFLDDGNQAGSTWAQTGGIKLSDTTGEWDAFETAFGEVSLLNAIVAAQGSAARAKQHANVTANIPANTVIDGSAGTPNISAQMPSYKGLGFEDDVDVFINGQLQRPGANAGINNDVYPAALAADQALGKFHCEFALKFRGGTNPDVVIMTAYGTPTP